ncbi:hypothetical protein VP01_4288g1 [Puccinia sorghi]|uniref:Uncharacterized protein n=1 Tax=Puccinia sorghi TaxID=27349 RepID=A0A0L6UQ72_9BASI|nr:hypothetical protein VP01_4288g1 [Puccinia sorghi]
MVRASERKSIINTLELSIKADMTNLALEFRMVISIPAAAHSERRGNEKLKVHSHFCSLVVNLEFIMDLILDSDTTEEDKSEPEDENDSINDIEEKALLLVAVQSQHYLKPSQIEKAPPIIDFLSSVFHNNSQHPQHPVEKQMMVELKRLGCFGNASSLGMLANYFGIAKGAVEIYTNHFIVAIKVLREKFLKWPNTEACQEIQEDLKSFGTAKKTCSTACS